MSDTEESMSTEEIAKVVSALKQLKMKPKADSAEDFLSWMSSAVQEKKIKEEVVSTDTASASPRPAKSLPPSQFPKIPFFSGDSKNDATYEVWRYEVECLYNESYSPDVIHHAIRRSLKGEASRVVMHLGPGARISSIIQKLDSIYGTVAEKEDILSEFYSARQREDEECARWSCRLEDILNKAIQKNLIDRSQFEEMLRTMFFKGLRPSLKDICGHLYDKCKSFDELRTSVRKLEIEHHPQTTEKKSATAKAATVKDQSADRFDSIEAKINQLTTEVRSMKEKEYSYTPMPQPYRAPRQPYQRGRQERGYRGGYRQYPRFPQPQTTDVAKEPQSSRVREPPTCYRCGQVGHIAVGCRVLVNHRRQALNYNTSAPGDKGLARGSRVPEKNN